MDISLTISNDLNHSFFTPDHDHQPLAVVENVAVGACVYAGLREPGGRLGRRLRSDPVAVGPRNVRGRLRGGLARNLAEYGDRHPSIEQGSLFFVELQGLVIILCLCLVCRCRSPLHSSPHVRQLRRLAFRLLNRGLEWWLHFWDHGGCVFLRGHRVVKFRGHLPRKGNRNLAQLLVDQLRALVPLSLQLEVRLPFLRSEAQLWHQVHGLNN